MHSVANHSNPIAFNYCKSAKKRQSDLEGMVIADDYCYDEWQLRCSQGAIVCVTQMLLDRSINGLLT